jgi:DNA-binding transcriptional ArsR family regulator
MARKKAEGGKKGKSAKKKPATSGRRPANRRRKRSSKELLNYRHMRALSNKERVEILAILCERIASPKQISLELDAGLSQVSYHVTVLRECGLILPENKVPRRGAVEHFYRAVTPTLIPPDTWGRLPAAVRKSISMSILQCFFEDAWTSIEAGVFDEVPGELSWTPLILDSLGLEEFGQLARDFSESALNLQAKVSKRLPKGNGRVVDATSATVFVASFLSARSPEENKRASATKRR